MATEKWSDAAVKDLTFAILMSNNTDGSVNVKANWDNVEATMNQWGYAFTKSAMSQHWSKKVLKEFKERHGTTGNGDGNANPVKVATPRKPRAPKKPKTPGTEGSGRGKKRVAADGGDDDTSPEGHPVRDPIAQNKTPHSTTKKVKTEHHNEHSEDADSSEKAQVKGDAVDDDDYAI